MKNEQLIECLLKSMFTDKENTKDSPFKIGDKWFIRTVTHYLTGRITKVYENFIELEDAAWIADTGRFNESIKTGIFSEVEPVFVPVLLNTTSIIDCYKWEHAFPREVK